MSRPLVSVVIPTIGRLTLERTLRSMRRQVPEQQAELLVVADSHRDTYRTDLTGVPALCEHYSARYLEHDGGLHCYGQPQRQYGMGQAAGSWLLFSQDDAIWTETAWETLSTVLPTQPLPHLFRVQTKWGLVVWATPSAVAIGNVDADCIAVPNDPEHLGTWGLRYEGDYDFIASTLARWDQHVHWCDRLIAYSSPTAPEDWTWSYAQSPA